ncbi:uncharacterized protein PFL1_06087 [Pseudozyma flocculosa PF-1]|uniref:Alpha-1,3-glucosyltransferase n=2 Tax=Pseudozyma flocculosa TaxID=84751 RepID=A0A5C3F5N0_9BASI|nr:uncharacterized protein PFL1_06087 [Pseudozyma flocculosa PF-1]EPQ26439.1 hypothetical protein PFL1_06087 [Pseudozyma flocculosa PF-1]SPO38967.1 related to glucosyltransferase [Pseudozyma flocculosa]
MSDKRAVDGPAPVVDGTHPRSPGAPLPWLTSWERDLLALSTAFKLLLWPCYHSTDFEVHRNWLAITHSLPIRHWYFDSTSQWTLDYPPFFAYFSWLLAQPAPLVDPLIVSLHEGIDHAAWPAKAYMRATVLITELVLGAALVAHARFGSQRALKSGHGDVPTTSSSAPATATATATTDVGSSIPKSPSAIATDDTATLLAASLFLHPGLVIIDHIHFQYNGFLFGVLLWSLWAAREDRPLLCAFLFSSLLNLKHIYIYIAPPFVVYLLRAYIYPPGSQPSDLPKSLERLIILGAVTLAPFLLSLVPLAIDGARGEAGATGTLSQMVSRLFPFSRGLIHAYWAPNAWALWAFADRALVKLFQRRPELIGFLPHRLATKFHASAAAEGLASASRGLVGHVSFAVLPDILPPTCFLLTLTCMLVYLFKLWQAPTYRSFLSAISLCGFASFLFGWHVHEKAIMLVLVPYTFLAADDYAHFRTFVILSTAGIVSLFPLLYEAAETPIKLGFTLLWSLVVFGSLSKRVYRPITSNLGIAVHPLETAYLYGFLLLQLYVSVLHPLVFPAPPSAAVSLQPSPASAAIPARASLSPAPSIAPPIATDAATPIAAGSHESISDAAPEVSVIDTILPTAEAAAADPEPTASSSPQDIEVDQAQAPATPAEAVDGLDDFSLPDTEPIAAAGSNLASSSDLLQSAASTAVAASPTAAVAATADASIPAAAPPSTPPPVADPSSSAAMEFLPLMLVSVYCAIGVVWAWLRASSLYLAQQY